MIEIFNIQNRIAELENDTAIFEEKNFDERIDASQLIDHLIDSMEELLQKNPRNDKFTLLRHRAEKIKLQLEKIDDRCFEMLHQKILTSKYRRNKFNDLINEYFNISSYVNDQHGELHYDNFDIFINQLLPFGYIPKPTKELEPEMVEYQKTPARVVFELVDRYSFSNEDIFVDIGSGLGQVAILFHLLTGLSAIGVEFEPVFCRYAIMCANKLNLSQVAFINVDARKADYSKGNIFFMYTPFKGEMLNNVLKMLRKESLKRKIKVIAFGPCTTQVVSQSWLACDSANNGNIHTPWIFSSL